MNNYRDIIKAPIITEKTARLAEEENTITFSVDPKANKTQIKQAIEKIFDVEVESVSTGCDAGTPTFTNTTLSFDAKLNKPGDEITYKVTVANKGTIDATLNNVIFTEGEGSDAINYTTTNLANDLAVNEETSFFIIVTYEDVDIPPTDTTKSLTGMIEYVQK